MSTGHHPLRSPGWFEVVVLLALPLVAVSVVMWVSRPAEAIIAQVIEASVRPEGEGLLGDVTWVEDGVRRVRSVEMTAQQVATGTVPVVVVEGETRVVDVSEEMGPSAIVLVATGAIALAFALVVLATLRGFGFVRGTGSPGEMAPDEIQESHGFYWRH